MTVLDAINTTVEEYVQERIQAYKDSIQDKIDRADMLEAKCKAFVDYLNAQRAECFERYDFIPMAIYEKYVAKWMEIDEAYEKMYRESKRTDKEAEE